MTQQGLGRTPSQWANDEICAVIHCALVVEPDQVRFSTDIVLQAVVEVAGGVNRGPETSLEGLRGATEF